MNDRYNAARRLITKTVFTKQTCVEAASSGKSLKLVQNDLDLRQRASPGFLRISVRYTTMLPAHGKNCYLCSGLLEGTNQIALAISQSNASTIEVPNDQTLVLEENNCSPAVLRAVAVHLIAKGLAPELPPSGSVLLYEPEEDFVSISDSQWNNPRIFCASSRSSTVTQDWIKLHPRSSHQRNKHLLPQDLSCVIDFSGSLPKNVRSCLPHDCITIQPTINNTSGLHYLLKNSYSDAISTFLELNEPTTIHVKDLAVNSTPTSLHHKIIDWSDLSAVDVPIQPLNTTSMFSSAVTYLLVGMTGELGLSIASWMIKNGARHIVLTSRNPVMDTRWLKEMSKLGANVQYLKMDVSDRSSVQSVVNNVKSKMPPIRGVCNAAMVLSDKLFVNMDADSLNNILGPKVDGSRYLDEIFDETPLDFFILFSSLASIIGNTGQSNYHAANLFMASLASQRRKKGLAASVIHIGLVTDVGYVARKGRAMEEHLRNLFFMPLSESDVHHFFAEAVLAGRPDSSASSELIIGLQSVIDSPDVTARPPWEQNPRLSHFVIKEASLKEHTRTGLTAANIKQKIEEVDSEAFIIPIIQSAFSSKLEAMMQLASDSVNVNIPLIDLGCDSLLAVEIRSWFLREFRMDVPILKILSGDTVAQICEDATKRFLALKLKEAGKKRPSLPQDAETVKVKQHSSVMAANRDKENLDLSDNSDSERGDMSSNSGSEQTHSQGLSTPPSPTGTETPLIVQSSSFDLVNKVPNDSQNLGIENSFQNSGKMSYAQSRLWFLSKYLEDPTTYNVTVSYSVKGNLQISRLNQALATTISHHQSLQTSFFEQPENGSLMQGVLSKPSYLLKHVQSKDDTGIEQEFEILRRHLWDLEKGRTFGVTIVSQSPCRNTIIFGYHHIVMDGVSWYIFLRDLDLAYRMQGLKQAPRQYLDFSREQLQAAENGDFASELQFWEEQHSQLLDVIPLLPIARTKARTTLHNYNSHVQSREINQDLVLKIKRASQNLRATPFHFHLAVIQIIFFRFLGIMDLCIGVADANRTDDDFSETVGFFLNLLPIRFQVGKGDNFTDLVQRTSQKIYAALSNSKVPFDLVLERLNVLRSPAYSPLFQVAVNYRMGTLLHTPLGDCRLEVASTEDAKNPYDISFGITQTSPNTCLLELTCQNLLYTPEASRQLMDIYIHLLESLSTDPSVQIQDCTMVDDKTINQALCLGRGPEVHLDWPVTLSERFDNIQRAYPNEIAVKDKTGPTTYSLLAQKVNNVAFRISKDLDVGTRVAVLCEPSSDSIACMLAILRLNCVYVPLDLSLPVGRQAAMLQNCKPGLILYHSATHELVLDLISACSMDMNTIDIFQLECQAEEVKRLAQPNTAAFLFYTSGSTGTPKGIVLSQANFVNHLAVKTNVLSIKKEVVLQQSSLGFDMSIIQTFCALANGGTLVVAPIEVRGDPVKLSMLLLQEKVTFTIATPTEYMMMLQYGNEFLKEHVWWNRACMGGETVSDQLMLEFQRLCLPRLRLTNCYGPTEITAAATFEQMALDTASHGREERQNVVGKALPNYSIYILDEHRRPVPVGVSGEICISGAGVALGYLDLPKQTELRFPPNAYATGDDIAHGWTRMYLTGDKGRLLPDGSLVFMGRISGDTQVKLRGLRIELEDVSNAILKAGSGLLSDAVVTTRGDPPFLIAHVTLTPGTSMSKAQLKQLVTNLPLPQYMVPSMIIPLERLPTNSNGKIDRKAIGLLPIVEESQKSPYTQRLTLSEGELLLLWQRVLPQSTDLQPDSDFFMHGGNSILLMKLQGVIKECMGVSTSIMELYQASTLSKMAIHVGAKREEQRVIDEIDWVVETTVSEVMLVTSRNEHNFPQKKDSNREVLLTGATSFLGGAVLAALIEDGSLSKIHCIAIPPESKRTLPKSEKIVCYSGSLLSPTLGLSEAECIKLRSSVNLIIHAGANGHCLNNYSSLRVPNFHSTRFLARLALPRLVPVHFLSSNRVTLLSGNTSLHPVSVSSFLPSKDGSEGFTASKWASERFLENLSRKTGLPVRVHRACAVTGDEAPNEDALNALLRYSMLTRAVPRFENFEGFFDFRDVDEVASEIVAALADITYDNGGFDPSTSIRFFHYSSGIKVPVDHFRQYMEKTCGCLFEELSVADWIERAMTAGIDPLVTSYLEAMVLRGEIIKFPYLGKMET